MEVTNKRNMPKNEHWAIVTYSSVHHAGDERSRTNPGHGYPAYNEEIVKYQAYDNMVDWKEAIYELKMRNDSFQAMKVIPAKITTNIEVLVDE